MDGFNSRSRVGSDIHAVVADINFYGFNSRSRVGSDAAARSSAVDFTGFNSRSRVGSDPPTRCSTAPLGVSIRAPAWGATRARPRPAQKILFQFALPRGERRRGLPVASPINRFNSRSRVGSDVLRAGCLLRVRVSIRAPAWGATNGATLLFDSRDVSIRAPAWGATIMVVRIEPEEKSFNSRSRVGSDPVARSSRQDGRVSIRAPAWGATKPPVRNPTATAFQFALPRGERRNHRRRQAF